MKKFLFIVAYLTVLSTAYGQLKSLTAKLTSADSVYLVSHQSIPHSSISVFDSLGKEISFPLIVNGNLNESSIKEKVLLNAIEIRDLAKMLSYRKDSMIEQGSCFDPHHAIIIIKARKLSYIDLCFGCMNFSTSKDVSLSDIEEKTWKDLYVLYNKKGIKYAMHGD